MRRLLLLAALTLAGCAAGERPQAAVKGPCRNDGLDAFVGRKASAETGAALLKASGARTLRWGGPGMAMTMDYRADRLTVGYDEAMVITSARCG
jgi:hypothetical protein